MFELRLSEKMLLALLRSSLHQEKADTAFFSNVSSDDWQACYQLAVSQGVKALAWEGVMTLPAALQPPKALKLNWALSVEACEKRYRRYCQVADELSRFYAAHGIAMLQIKGVGYSPPLSGTFSSRGGRYRYLYLCSSRKWYDRRRGQCVGRPFDAGQRH